MIEMDESPRIDTSFQGKLNPCRLPLVCIWHADTVRRMAILTFSYTFRYQKCFPYILNPDRFCGASHRSFGLMDAGWELMSARWGVAVFPLQEDGKVSHSTGIYNEATKKKIQRVYLSETTKTRNI